MTPEQMKLARELQHAAKLMRIEKIGERLTLLINITTGIVGTVTGIIVLCRH
jgi:hypothetical protein